MKAIGPLSASGNRESLSTLPSAIDDLSLSLLRPVFRSEERDVVSDFVELFKLPARLSRLTEFANNTLARLDDSERIALAKVLTS